MWRKNTHRHPMPAPERPSSPLAPIRGGLRKLLEPVGKLGRACRPTRLRDAIRLFGCAPKRPLDYLGSAGLLWAINGGRLLELHRDWAVIDLPIHGSKRIFSRRNVDPAKITLPWAKPTSSRPSAAFGRQGSGKAGRPRRP